MFKLFGNLFSGNKNSKKDAKSRLHFVLVQDRSGLSNDELGDFKKELVGVLKKYFVIDVDTVEVDYQRESDSTTLVINSPVLRRKIEGGKEMKPKNAQNSAKNTGKNYNKNQKKKAV